MDTLLTQFGLVFVSLFGLTFGLTFGPVVTVFGLTGVSSSDQLDSPSEA